jgi:anti-anti-sigma regulatory factor
MNQKFQAAVHQRDEMTYVKLAGVIDEDNELTELAEKIPSGTVVIDLSEIERINSCGVRDWVNWLGKIEKNGSKTVLVECSPAIVAQVNLVNNFTGGGVVKSFFAPYFCPNCDREKVLLVEAAELGAAPHKAPTCRCDECDGVMDFDDMEDSYFAFLSNARKVADAAKIQKVISEFSPAEGEKSKIRSRVGSTGVSGVSGGIPSSLPSVPSLPSISRTGSQTGLSSFSGGGSGVGTGPGRIPFGKGNTGVGSTSGTNPGSGSMPGLAPPPGLASAPMPGKSSPMVYILVGVLLVAIGILAVLLFGGKKKTSAIESTKPAVAAAKSQ